MDAVPGPDGALYVSDDITGAIYRLTPLARPTAPGGALTRPCPPDRAARLTAQPA